MSQITISKAQIEQSKKNPELVVLTAKQVQKDFAMFGIQVSFSNNTNLVYDELFTQLNRYVQDMLDNNYDKLVSLIYQIDLNKKELAKPEPDIESDSISELITYKILEREFKKILIRLYFKEKEQ
ncbi:MAG: hypothetical protein MI739_08895 [Bacteroidales bacterium]|nr:hypothetical protein [Bacteroidales bacterium]